MLIIKRALGAAITLTLALSITSVAFADGQAPAINQRVIYPVPPGLSVAPPADAILQSWAFPDTKGSTPVYFSVTGMDCELRVVSFKDGTLRTDLYPCKMLQGSNPFSPIREGKAEASVNLPEGQSLLSFDLHYNSVTMMSSLPSASLPSQVVFRYSFPWIPLLDITVADQPPLHLTVKGFDCSLSIEGRGTTKCVAGTWGGTLFTLYVDGGFLKEKQPIVQIVVNKTDQGWQMAPYSFGDQIPAPAPPSIFGSIELKEDDVKDFVFDQRFLTGAQGFVADLQRYEAAHPAYVFGADDPKQWTGHLIHDQDIKGLLAKNGLTTKQLASGFLMLGLYGIAGGLPHGCESNTANASGGKPMTPSVYFLCMHAYEFDAMARAWGTLK